MVTKGGWLGRRPVTIPHAFRFATRNRVPHPRQAEDSRVRKFSYWSTHQLRYPVANLGVTDPLTDRGTDGSSNERSYDGANQDSNKDADQGTYEDSD